MEQVDVAPTSDGTPDGQPLAPEQTPVEESPVLPEPQDSPDTHDAERTPDPTDTVDYKKRYADTQRWAQGLQSDLEREKQELASLKAKMDAYQKAGLDFNEIDAAIDSLSGKHTESKQVAGVSKTDLEAFQQRMQAAYNWDIAKRTFLFANPTFKDPEMAELLDSYAIKEVQKEQREFGGKVISTADDIFSKAGKRSVAFVNRFREQGKKEATEQRQKLKDIAVPKGGSTDKKQPSAEDAEGPGYSARDYAKGVMDRYNRLRSSTGPGMVKE